MSDCIKKQDEIDWSKVKIDTPILVSSDGKTWINRYFAGCTNGKVHAWVNGDTSQTVQDFFYTSVPWKYAKLADNQTKVRMSDYEHLIERLRNRARGARGLRGMNCKIQIDEALSDDLFLAADIISDYVRIKQERDAAIRDMKAIADAIREERGNTECCFACKYDADFSVMPCGEPANECPGFDEYDCFEWRGTKE